MIELRDLKKVYPSKEGDVVALERVDLTIEDGAIYGIIGLSGAGKSTLVRCINLLEKPTEGRVVIDGEDLTKVKRKRLLEIRKNIGMIFQSFNLLEQRTVEANVRFPLEIARARKTVEKTYKRKGADGKKETVTEPKEVCVRYSRGEMRGRVAELLELVGLSDKAKAYPSQLSGGQKQRVAIARALALNPKYLLCDEATSALDPNTTTSILELLREINRRLGVTIIVITHEMRVVESICSEVAVIDQSRIVESGKVADVFSFPKSEIAKELIIPGLIRSVKSTGGKKLRLVFNGEEADTPIISGLALRCGISVNILYADTKNIDGKTYGHMVIALPEEEEKAELAKRHLKELNINFKEEL